MDVELFILDWIQAHLRHPLLDPVMVFITTLGNAGILWIALTILLALKKSTRKTAAALAIALMLCLVSGNLLLKPLVGRIRPFHAQELVTLLIETPTDYSFPSGHTMSSFAAATAYWQKSSIRLAVFGSMNAFASKSLTSAATWHL